MSRVTFLVIPSEVEESLTFCLSSIRDVSTSLDMTKNGQHESDLPFSGNRRHRVPLLLRRPRRRVRLHRRDDAVRARNHYHPADCVGTEHPGCAHRVFSILAGRAFLMEIILAVRSPFCSGCLLRRLSPVTSSNFENHYWTRAAFLRRPIVFSSGGSSSGRSPAFARRTRRWFRHRVSLRSDRHRRRNFSHTSFTFFQLGENKTGIGGFCVIYFGKFNCWSGRFC